MSALAKQLRGDMRAKAERLANGTDPHKKVDGSDWTPPEPLNTYRKTGARPIRPMIYKSGGAVQGDRGPRRADRKPRATGGKADGGLAGKIANAYVNRDVRKANAEEFGSYHKGGFKRGGRAEGGEISEGRKEAILNRLRNKQLPDLESYREVAKSIDSRDKQKQKKTDTYGYKKGGRTSDEAQDKAAIKAAVHKHEKHDHKGQPLTPLKKGGKAGGGNWIAGAIKHPGALHKSLGVPKGEKIPEKKLEKAEHSKNPKLAKRARLAETLKDMHKSGGRAGKWYGGAMGGVPAGGMGAGLGVRPALPPAAGGGWGGGMGGGWGGAPAAVPMGAPAGLAGVPPQVALGNMPQLPPQALANGAGLAQGRPFAKGGRAKGKTNINIVIAHPGQNQPPSSMMPGPIRPPMPVPVPAAGQGTPVPSMGGSGPPGGMMGPGAAPMGGPGPLPGPLPMGRATGGRAMSGNPPKTASSPQNMRAGAGSGLGRLEKASMQKKKR